ncbi:MAG: lasso peptide biosynthesis B2 protein, partial [Cyanobacteria bacterium P01_H01_bin.58]
LGLWLLPFRIVLKFSTIQGSEPSNVASLPTRKTYSIKQLSWSIQVASRYSLGEVRCLAKALAMCRLMAKYGYQPMLLIGVTHNTQGQFVAHAWVEHNSEVVMGKLPNLNQYVPLPSLQKLSL